MESKGDGTQDQQSALLSDLKKIENFRSEFTVVERSILDFTADPNEVIAWHHATDPLSESDLLEITRREKDNLHEVVKKRDSEAVLQEVASALVISSVFYPEAYSSDPNKRIENINKIVLQEASTLVARPESPLHTQDIFLLGLERGKKMNLSTGDLEKLLIGTELLTDSCFSGQQIRFELRSQLRKFLNEELKDEDYQLIEWETKKIFIAQKIQKFIIDQTLGNNSTDTEAKFIGLDAYSDVLSAEAKAFSDEGDSKSEQFLKMISYLENVFLDSDILNTNKTTSSIRGKLYEYLWLLDANLHIRMLGKKLKVWKARTFEDKPQIGYPEHKRGFDIKLFDPESYSLHQIQLKSKPTPHFKKNYHPLIETVHEQNFLDANPKRLKRKFETYRRYIKSGYSEEEIDEVKKYLLPSVTDTITKFEENKRGTLRPVEELYKDNGQNLTRAERRRRQRLEKKQNKQKKGNS